VRQCNTTRYIGTNTNVKDALASHATQHVYRLCLATHMIDDCKSFMEKCAWACAQSTRRKRLLAELKALKKTESI
jgi:hypothetical protein